MFDKELHYYNTKKTHYTLKKSSTFYDSLLKIMPNRRNKRKYFENPTCLVLYIVLNVLYYFVYYT